MPQKDENQNSSTRLTTGGFANMIVFIIFLLTMGGTVLYFKKFPLTQTPSEQPTEQPQAVETQKQVPTNPLSSTEKESVAMGVSPTQHEIEICNEAQKYIDAKEKLLVEYNSKKPSEISANEQKNFEKNFQEIDKKTKDTTAKCQEIIDKNLLSAIKKLQGAFELYHDTCNGYPIVPTHAFVGTSQLDISFNKGCPVGKSLGSLVDKSLFQSFNLIVEYCSEETPGSGKCGVPVGGKAESYHLTFTTRSQQGLLAPGVHVATPKGIQ